MSSSPAHSPRSIAEVIGGQKRGEAWGLVSVCSAHPSVLAAAMKQAKQSGSVLLIESTANQVNQFGGYMGLTPSQFQQSISILQKGYRLAPHQVILGGDHLGPTVWQDEPAEIAMPKGAKLVEDCVRAGYTKIHLDASMLLGGDPSSGLPLEICAARTAQLCKSAEAAASELPREAPRPCYVVGTEVPPPGGETGNQAELMITTAENARRTLEATRHAFEQADLLGVWERVIALVVQPGVDFGNRTIHAYRRQKDTEELSRFIETVPGMVYEAHSTDYQTPPALRQMVEDHFAIMKVGPALTFAFREAVFALEMIEKEMLGRSERDRLSRLQDILEEEMLAEPKDWARYYPGGEEEQRFLRRFSLSDRIRYYWTNPRVSQAFKQLFSNLKGRGIPATLVSQYLPQQYLHHQMYSLELSPDQLIEDKIIEAMLPHYLACNPTMTVASTQLTQVSSH